MMLPLQFFVLKWSLAGQSAASLAFNNTSNRKQATKFFALEGLVIFVMTLWNQVVNNKGDFTQQSEIIGNTILATVGPFAIWYGYLMELAYW